MSNIELICGAMGVFVGVLGLAFEIWKSWPEVEERLSRTGKVRKKIQPTSQSEVSTRGEKARGTAANSYEDVITGAMTWMFGGLLCGAVIGGFCNLMLWGMLVFALWGSYFGAISGWVRRREKRGELSENSGELFIGMIMGAVFGIVFGLICGLVSGEGQATAALWGVSGGFLGVMLSTFATALGMEFGF